MTDTEAPATRPARASGGRHLIGLEGPRGFGFFCVVLVHTMATFSPEFVAATRIDFLGQALTFFFVLSAFLLYMPWVKNLVRGRPRPATRDYLMRRALRVFPAYLVVFLIVNYVLRVAYLQNPVVAGWDRLDDNTGMITDPGMLLANLTLTQTLFPQYLQTGITPAWSLTAEWGFYLALPLLGLLLSAVARRVRNPIHAALVPPAVMLVVGLGANLVVEVLQSRTDTPILETYWGPNGIAVLARSSLAIADNFAFGMLAAVVYVALSNGALAHRSTAWLQRTFGTVMVVGIVASLAFFVLMPHYLAAVFAFAAAFFILTIVTPSARGEDSRLARTADWAPLRYVGQIGLSAYLWHYPVLILADRWGLPVPDGPVGGAIAYVVVLVVSIALASLTYHVIEVPAMKLRV